MKVTKSLSSEYAQPVEWADEPSVAVLFSYEPAVVQAVRPAQPATGKKFMGNASKRFCILERKGRAVRFIGSMAECQQKLLEKKDPRYCMTLYRA